ncbi:hypothetical protein D3C72_1353900 [compost metagenome]
MLHRKAKRLAQHNARCMAAHAGGVRGEQHSILLRLAIVGQLLQGVDRQVLVGDQHQAVAAELRKRLQVLERLVMHLVGQWRFADDAALDDEEGGAVLAVAGQVVHGQCAGCTGLGFDDHRLAQFLVQSVGQQTRQCIGVAASRPAHDQAQWLACPACLRLSGRHAAGQGQRGNRYPAAWGNLPAFALAVAFDFLHGFVSFGLCRYLDQCQKGRSPTMAARSILRGAGQ